MKWIVTAFVFFALFIGTLVTISMREDVSLVSKTYYEDELRHSEKMARQANAEALVEQPQIMVENKRVMVVHSKLTSFEKGKLEVLRPSDSRLDQTFELSQTDTAQYFSLPISRPGLYRAILTWSMDGKEYQFEKLIML